MLKGWGVVSPVMAELGAMKPHEIRAMLLRAGYRVVRQKGSHTRLEAEGRQSLTLALHAKEVSPRMAKKILMTDAGLTDEELERLR